jgi:hypothetical protein
MLRHSGLALLLVSAVVAGCSRQPLAPDSIAGSDTGSAAGTGAAASANAASKDEASVHLFGTTTVVPGAYSTLIRNDRGVTMTFHTSGLVDGNGYTVWWIVFNNPAACTAGTAPSKCGLGDLPKPAVRASLVFATGHVVGNGDSANFGAWLGVGDLDAVLPNPPSPAGPYGLENARTADIHIVVRSHGPADPQLLPDQINSFLGGCSATNPCANVQGSTHDAQTR